AMDASIIEMFGSNPMDSEDLGTIIDAKHFAGLIGLLHHGTILSGGEYDEKRLKIEPTLLGDVDLQSPLMQAEIFGPLLPIIEYEHFDEALSWVRDRPHPLAAYLFSNDPTHQKRFVAELPFGGGCINDVVLHLANSRLPFGGVGPSGMGNYHGEAGFLAFSHIKSITKSSRLIDVPVRYAPYKGKLGLLKALFR
ncbi:MAG: aldehyde dehydrogenase family protein, partial [Sphaerochaeta sp.]